MGLLARRLGLAFALSASLLLPGRARAQDAPPPYVAVLDGQATLIHDGQADDAFVNVPLVEGDRLETSTGRVDILFPDGTTLDLDESSQLDVQSPTLFRLMAGRLLLTIARTAESGTTAAPYQIDTPVASVETEGPGSYRVSAIPYSDGPVTELAVLRGQASLTTDAGDVQVGAGRVSTASDRGRPSLPQPFNSARFDAFDRWAASVQAGRVTTADARRYLPPDLQVYGGLLGRNGDWRYLAPYGYVWYPRVAPTWRPYYYGRWAPYPIYGWTWIGATLWSWPTHHYGRWGFAGGWYWIPDRRWGPGWVSWAASPGYVAWSPLGFDGGPVFGLSVAVNTAPLTSWVFVSTSHFGRSWHADRFAVAPRQLPRASRFVVRQESPIRVPAGTAVSVRTNTGPGRAGGVRAPSAPRAVERAPGRAPSNAEQSGARPTDRNSGARAPSFGAPRAAQPRAQSRRPEQRGQTSSSSGPASQTQGSSSRTPSPGERGQAPQGRTSIGGPRAVERAPAPQNNESRQQSTGPTGPSSLPGLRAPRTQPPGYSGAGSRAVPQRQVPRTQDPYTRGQSPSSSPRGGRAEQNTAPRAVQRGESRAPRANEQRGSSSRSNSEGRRARSR